MESAIVHIDGASRGNPGPSAYAFTIKPPGDDTVEEYGKMPDTTNNVAEYTAMLNALEKAKSLGLKSLHIHSDSELLVKQMNGEYRVKNHDLKQLYDEAQGLLRSFTVVKFTHVRRENNKRADQLCNICLDADKPKSAPTEKAASTSGVSMTTVREDCIASLESVRGAWAARASDAPTAEQVWEQLWFILEDAGVVKKPKRK